MCVNINFLWIKASGEISLKYEDDAKQVKIDLAPPERRQRPKYLYGSAASVG